MIFTQRHQIIDKAAAGAQISEITDMVADYLRGLAAREKLEQDPDAQITEDNLPEITGEEIEKWLTENYADLRRAVYPPWERQLELIYEDEPAWRDKIKDIKNRFPKTRQ